MSTAQCVLGELLCPADSLAWKTDNQIRNGVVFAFPRTPVVIVHENGRRFVADRTSVMLYNPGQHYRRELVDSRGDDCLFLAVPTNIFMAAAAEYDESVQERPDAPLLLHRTSLEQDTMIILSRLLACPLKADELQTGAAIMNLLESLVCSCYPTRAWKQPSFASTMRAHAQIVEETRCTLASSYKENMSIATLARKVCCNPYHLTRVFRACTGKTIVEYRTELRIRAAMLSLANEQAPIVNLAMDLGFSSHAHFTTVFRKTVGVPPSIFRLEIANHRGMYDSMKKVERSLQ